MSTSPGPPDRPISDAAWADYGAGTTVPTWRDPGRRGRPVGWLVLAAAVAGCGLLLIARWGAGDPAWLPIVYVVLAALGGAAGGRMASRRPEAGAAGGAIAGAGSLAAMATALDRSIGDPLLAIFAGLAGLLPGLGAYYLLRRLARSKPVARPAPPVLAPAPAPAEAEPPFFTPQAQPEMAVIYEPLSADPDPREVELLQLCQQDRQLFERLIEQEQATQPHLPRADLVRLAIQHFRRDKQ